MGPPCDFETRTRRGDESRQVVTFTNHPRRWLGAALAVLRTAATAAGFALVGSYKSPLRNRKYFAQGLYEHPTDFAFVLGV